MRGNLVAIARERSRTMESVLRMYYDRSYASYDDFYEKYPWLVGLYGIEKEDMMDAFTSRALGEAT